MNISTLLKRSLKTRVTLFSLTIFLASIWVLAWHAATMLREDILRHVVLQQRSTLAFVADEINQEIQVRLGGLEDVALMSAPAMLQGPAAMQAFIDQQPILRSLFNGRIFVQNIEGTTIACSPTSSEVIGMSYMDRDYVSTALKMGKTNVGIPVIGKVLVKPLFGMSAPIRDGKGNIIGALSGTVNMGKPNFLDTVTQNRYGNTGGYTLVSPQHRMIITSTDKRGILQTSPDSDITQQIDHYFHGEEGTAIFVNATGVEVMRSTQNIPAAQWFVVVDLPTAEAFAPIHAMQKRLLIITLLLTLISGVLTWWMLKRQLSPMVQAAKTLSAISNGIHVDHLPLTTQDEIGVFISGFNRLLESLGETQQALQTMNAQLTSTLQAIPDLLFEMDQDGRYLKVFAHNEEFLAVPKDAILGHTVREVLPPEAADICMSAIEQAVANGYACGQVIQLDFVQGSRWFELSSSAMTTQTGQHILMLSRDITDRKRVELELRHALLQLKTRDHALAHISQGVLLASPQRVITYVNEGVQKMTGYSAGELIGQKASIFQGVNTDPETVMTMRAALNEQQAFRTVIRNYRKDGTEFWNDLSITPVFNEQGQLIEFVGVQHDISEHKQNEEDIRMMAFYDPLTNLPNRRLLIDRLGQALSASKRSTKYGALMFIDLDNFKPLNDAYGHGVGDLLLVEAAHRLTACVRGMDTLARYGGDEFVVVLGELEATQDRSASQAHVIAEKILTSLTVPYVLSVKRDGEADMMIEHQCTASIGVVLFFNHESSLNDLLKWADAAMYMAKASGKNAIRFYEPP